jgi:hypothetical protein
VTAASAEEVVRLRLQSLLARGLAAPEVARRVGLAAASEVWGGDAPRERAAWYVWLRERPGAWQLVLAGAEPLPGPARRVLGRLTVRHYPAAGPTLDAFDPEERAAALAVLDPTGTPRIELASRLGAHLFVVGTVDWALDLERDASLFSLASQDRLRTREDGRVVRDVPGWTLASPIFSLLAGLHAQLDRRQAARLVLARATGFEVVREDGGPTCRDAVELAQGEASLLFSAADGCSGPGSALLLAARDEDATVVRDEWLAAAARPAGSFAEEPRLPVEVSSAWFGGELHFERSTCAC